MSLVVHVCADGHRVGLLDYDTWCAQWEDVPCSRVIDSRRCNLPLHPDNEEAEGK